MLLLLIFALSLECGILNDKSPNSEYGNSEYKSNGSDIKPEKSAEELERQKKAEEMRKNLGDTPYFNGIVDSFSDDQVDFFSKIAEKGQFAQVFDKLTEFGRSSKNLKNFKDMSVESLQDSFDFFLRNPKFTNSWVKNASEYAKFDKSKFKKLLESNKPLPDDSPSIVALGRLDDSKLDLLSKNKGISLYATGPKTLSWIETTPINKVKIVIDNVNTNSNEQINWDFRNKSDELNLLSSMKEDNFRIMFENSKDKNNILNKYFLEKMGKDVVHAIDALPAEKIKILLSNVSPNVTYSSNIIDRFTPKRISSLGKMSPSNLEKIFLLDEFLFLDEETVESFANLSDDKLSALLTDLDQYNKKSQLDKITKEQVNFLGSLSEKAIANLAKEGALALDAKYIDIFKDVDSEKKCIIFEKAKTNGVLNANRLTKSADYLDSLATFKSLPVENLKIVLDAVGNKVLLPNKGCIEALSKITDLDNIKVIAPYTLGDAPRINDKAIKILGNCNKTKVESITKSFYPNTNSIIFEKQFAFLSEKVSDQSKLPSLSKILQLSNIVNESFNMMIGIKSYCSDDDFMELLNKYSPAVLEKYISGQSEADIANAFGGKGGVLSYYDKDYAMNSPFSKSKVVNKLEILATLEKNGALN